MKENNIFKKLLFLSNKFTKCIKAKSKTAIRKFHEEYSGLETLAMSRILINSGSIICLIFNLWSKLKHNVKPSCHNPFTNAFSKLHYIRPILTLISEAKIGYFQTAIQCRKHIVKWDMATWLH